ncbi:MAG: sulfurtransferase TusA family protein [Candidatus Neomarinimicrobiota bacterium]
MPFDLELDCTGMLCPLPIVKTQKAILGMTPGQVLRMRATDKGALSDMQAWARQTGNRLLAHSEADGVFTFYLHKS